jgi:DNA modification methylase
VTVTILTGHALTELRKLPSSYFDCVPTSPPYWGLRNYNVDGQLGLERTLGEHIDVMVTVFREIRRVLKHHGTVWLNYGDCYATAPNGKAAAEYKADGSDDRTFRDKPFSTVGAIYEHAHSSGRGQRGDNTRVRAAEMPAGRVVAGGLLKPKDLCMIANRLAIALQDDGWYVRAEIVWHKPNPMPESIYDRPTMAHEKVWLLTKSEDYYYNHEAIREPVTGGGRRRVPGQNSRQNIDRVPVSRKLKVPGGWDVAAGPHGTIHRGGRTEATYANMTPGCTPKSAPEDSNIRAKGSWHASTTDTAEDRNARNVWTIASAPFDGEFCLACRSYFTGKGKRALRVEKIKIGAKEERRRYCICGAHDRWLSHFATFPPELARRCLAAGTPPTTCHLCGEAKSAIDCGGICVNLARDPGRALDPFGGAGTVALVAQRLGLDCTLIELNPDYAEMARKRVDAERPPPAAFSEAAE